MKKTTFFIVILLVSIGAFAQNREIDSLKKIVRLNTTSNINANAYQRLAWLHISKDAEIAKRYLDSSATLYNTLKDKEGFIQVQYKRAVINRFTGNYNKGLDQIQEFIDYKKSRGDSLSVADALFQKGVLQESKGDYSKGLSTYYRALAIYETNNESHSIANMYNSIGIIFKNFRQWDDAIESYKKAEAIQLKIKDNRNLSNTYNSLGSVFALKKDFDVALTYFNKGLKLNEELDSSYGIAMHNQNIGNVLFDQKKFENALPHFKIAYAIQKKNGFTGELLETLSALSLLYQKQKKYKLSELYLKEAALLDVDYNKGKQSFHKAYYKYHESQGDFKESLDHFQKYASLKDSIFNKDNQLIINGLKYQYQSEKKDKEIVQQQLDLEKSQAKTRTMTILIVSLLIASILLWFVFQQRQKRIQQQLVAIKKEQEVLTLESLIEGEEKERLRIAKELHDGVNGDLSAIKYKLSSLLKMNNEVINEAVQMIDSSCQQVRAISHNLIPPSLKDFKLSEAVHNYCENMNETHSPEIVFQHIGDPLELNKKTEVNIFRIIQELVTNAIKHAHADTIDVQISVHKDGILITVEDNGVGYKINENKAAGIGLSNIKSRVDYLNAKLDVVSNDKGTSNTIEIDLKNSVD